MGEYSFFLKNLLYILIMVKFLIIIIFTLIFNNSTHAKLSQKEQDFLDKIFQNSMPEKQRIILKSNAMTQMKKIMGHKYKKRIFSYW